MALISHLGWFSSTIMDFGLGLSGNLLVMVQLLKNTGVNEQLVPHDISALLPQKLEGSWRTLARVQSWPKILAEAPAPVITSVPHGHFWLQFKWVLIVRSWRFLFCDSATLKSTTHFNDNVTDMKGHFYLFSVFKRSCSKLALRQLYLTPNSSA